VREQLGRGSGGCRAGLVEEQNGSWGERTGLLELRQQPVDRECWDPGGVAELARGAARWRNTDDLVVGFLVDPSKGSQDSRLPGSRQRL
jgi:hypothetical protein